MPQTLDRGRSFDPESNPSTAPESSSSFSPQRLTYDSSRSTSTDSLDGLLSSNDTAIIKEKQTGGCSKNKKQKKNGGRSSSNSLNINPFTLWRRRGRLHRLALLLLLVSGVIISLIVSISMLGMRMQTHKILRKHGGGGARPWQAFPLLMSYYSGIKKLVPVDSNKPENLVENVVIPGRRPQNGRLPPPTPNAPPTIKQSQKVNVESSTISKPTPYSPYPDYHSEEYKAQWQGEFQTCALPDGRTLSGEEGTMVYKGVPSGMPDHTFGSYGVVGLDDSVCFERRSRLGVYGFKDRDESEKDSEAAGRNKTTTPGLHDEWGVDWMAQQRTCVEKNSNRFAQNTTTTDRTAEEKGVRKYRPRTAFVLRAWHDYEYQPLDYVNLRALITELNLLSGGEYDVHLLVHVRDHKFPIWADQSVYDQVIREHIAKEFQGMVTLWTENMMSAWYPNLSGLFRNLPVHGAYRSIWMPLQYFMLKHPEYDYVWNWELDVRYTGQYYHLLEKLKEFANKQPRKYLWERNSRFYVEKVHGSWEEFSKRVEMMEPINGTVWGPVKYPGVVVSDESPKPPFATPQEDINSEWGVGEEADLITLNPLFDPVNTEWGLRDDYTGYGTTPISETQRRKMPLSTISTMSSDIGPPRRVAIITPSRLSRRLIKTMHDENAFHGHTMFTEMWPATVALHHGYKAVFAPHPVYFDRKLPPRYVESMFNNGVRGSSGGRPQSVFGREHNFQGSSWYYNAEWPGAVWRRWLGWRWNEIGGEELEKENGRMCLRGMLLHPVKDLKA